MRILVTGATGTVGRHVVDGLVSAGVHVRGVTRRPATAGLPAGVETVGGDLDEPGELEPVFAGVDRVYLLAAGRTREVVDAARRAGVRRIVVLSSASAASEHIPGGAEHRAVEREIEQSGVEWTHIRPGMFSANLLDWAAMIRAAGVVREPYGAGRQAPVHERDIAEVAVAALLGEGHTGRAYALSGPEALTKPEQAAAIGRSIERSVRFEEVSPQHWREERGKHLPPEVSEFLLDLWADAVDHPGPVLSGVPDVLGRPGRTVAEWAADHAADFTGEPA